MKNKTNIFFKSLSLPFFLVLSLFFVSDIVLAQTDPVTETVTVSAQVGGDEEGGGGGGFVIPRIAVRFSGEAYPLAKVSVLKGGGLVASTTANAGGIFSVTLAEAYDSTILYTLFAEDISGERSLLINYPLAVHSGFLTHLSGIRFAPTILTDKAEVKFGDYLEVSGYSLPGRSLEVAVTGEDNGLGQLFYLVSGGDGFYRIVLPLSGLPRGDYLVSVKYAGDTRISKIIKFIIGDVNIPSAELVKNIPGDCNADNVINLVDFSVLAFWYGKDNPPACVDTNGDNKIDLVDFSILAFWWTG